VGHARCARDRRLDHGRTHVVDLRAEIGRNLRAFERVRSASAQTGAAVAIVVMENGGRPVVPIFQRSDRLRRHAGQMALPGGRMHPDETVEAAALRELEEELALVVTEEDVLGHLDDFDTRSGFTISPVVAWSAAKASDLRPSGDEVAQLFLIGLPELREAAAGALEGDQFSMRLPEVEVFAPTAAILYQFSRVALDGQVVRVGDFYQPPWTHR